jgi:homoserine kinase type II
MDVGQANRLYEIAERLFAETRQLRDALEVEFLNSQVAEVIETEYDLGKVERVEQLFGGFENLSFAVFTRRDGAEHRYFVRKYKRGTVEREIRYEHALVRHIRDRGFLLAAEVYATKTGETLVAREEVLDGEPTTCFFAVYEMLLGENKYTWVENRCTDCEYDDAARVLARFHQAACDFDPGELARQQPPIMDFMATLPDTFRGYAEGAKGTKYDAYFLEALPGVLEAIERGLALTTDLEGLPRCPVFCDYHPGNHKWVDEHSVGLFDFDWAKLDYRLFDIAVGALYFCSSWEGADDREMRLDKVELFVRAYQEEAARSPSPGPLTEAELAAFPRMLSIAALYVVAWDVVAYYIDRRPNDDEYLYFLQHNVAFVEHIEAHLDEVGQIAASIVIEPAPHRAAGEEGSP